AADPNQCDITPVDDFLALMSGINVRRSNSDAVAINSQNLPGKTEIQVLSYKF
ncbi:MAG: Zn-dependent hydrolase, partial [Cuspidothrix sp.]